MGRFYPVGLRLLSALFLGALLANCARPGSDRLIPTAAPRRRQDRQDSGCDHTPPASSPTRTFFTSQRARSLNYAEFTVALPPAPAFAAASATSVSNDPLERFSTVDQAILTREQFNAQLASRRHGILKQRVYVFVHGYNNNFQESLYRIAQMAADTRVDGPVILFRVAVAGAPHRIRGRQGCRRLFARLSRRAPDGSRGQSFRRPDRRSRAQHGRLAHHGDAA